MKIVKRFFSLAVYFFKRLYELIVFLIYPPYCAHCKKFLEKRSVFCKECALQIQPVATIPLKVTKKWSIPVLALSAYKKPVQQLILAKGRSNRTAAFQLAQLIWDRTPVRNLSVDYFVPIPLHWRRYAKRGYNQAEVIAKYLAQKKGAHFYNALHRVKDTKFQSSCSGKERTENVKDAFGLRAADKNQFKGKHLVIVDDLMTTGSTLQASVRELCKVSPASITAVVACRVTPR